MSVSACDLPFFFASFGDARIVIFQYELLDCTVLEW